jgi:hypothetical protein
MSDQPLARLTRDELYDLVWSKPLTALASELRVPNVVIAKTCDKLRVPRPMQGHWQGVALGKAESRPTLPAASVDMPAEAVFGRAETRNAPRVVIGSALSAMPHPVVRKLRAKLAADRLERNGMKTLRGERHAVLRVSANTEKRALRILDGLFCALEDRGHTVRLREGLLSAMEVFISGGGAVEVWLMEHLDQTEHRPTKAELENEKRGGYSWAPTHDVAASGRLILEIDTPWGYELRKRWADGKTQRLENVVGEVVTGLEAVGAAVRDVGEKKEREFRAEEDLRMQREVEQRRRAHREALTKDLAGLARSWSEATAVRAFLAATEQRVPESERQEGFSRWLDWAKQCADEMDPLGHPEKIAKVLEPKEPLSAKGSNDDSK